MTAPPRSAPLPRPAPPGRFAAWVVTGPLGHLYGGLADWLILVGRILAARARRAAR